MLAPVRSAGQQKWTPERLPNGTPDLQGTWSSSTLTPLERPVDRAEHAALTEQEAAALELRNANRVAELLKPSDPNRAAPPVGGAGGGNIFWLDGASTVATVAGRLLTSLVTNPPDGRIPFTPAGRRAQDRAKARYGVGPYESHEDLDTGERCITDGVPWTPYGANDNFLIVQTAEHVAVLREQYSELRIILMDAGPAMSSPVLRWLGESRGRWDNDTLVVETSNFLDRTSYEWADPWRAARPTLHVVERFTRVDERTIEYEFTVEDPTTFTTSWTAVVPMTKTGARMFEYACHEGNIAVVNTLRGTRVQEAETAKRKGAK